MVDSTHINNRDLRRRDVDRELLEVRASSARDARRSRIRCVRALGTGTRRGARRRGPVGGTRRAGVLGRGARRLRVLAGGAGLACDLARGALGL